MSGQDDKLQCEFCMGTMPLDEAHGHTDYWLCQKCHDGAMEAFNACDHNWMPDVDEFGDDTQYCDKCSCMVANDVFEDATGKPLPEHVAN